MNKKEHWEKSGSELLWHFPYSTFALVTVKTDYQHQHQLQLKWSTAPHKGLFLSQATPYTQFCPATWRIHCINRHLKTVKWQLEVGIIIRKAHNGRFYSLYTCKILTPWANVGNVQAGIKYCDVEVIYVQFLTEGTLTYDSLIWCPWSVKCWNIYRVRRNEPPDNEGQSGESSRCCSNILLTRFHIH